MAVVPTLGRNGQIAGARQSFSRCPGEWVEEVSLRHLPAPNANKHSTKSSGELGGVDEYVTRRFRGKCTIIPVETYVCQLRCVRTSKAELIVYFGVTVHTNAKKRL